MSESDNSLIEQFVELTNSNEIIAKQYLNSVSNVLDDAVQLFYAADQNNSESIPEPNVRSADTTTTEQLIHEYMPHEMFQEQCILPDIQQQTPEELNEDKSFDYILEQARKDKKLILVYVKSSGVFKCLHMNRDIWCNSGLFDIIKDNIICWQVNCEHPEGRKFCMNYNINTYPSICILENETTQKISHINSVDNYSDFISELMEVVDKYKTKYEEPVQRVISIPDEPEQSNQNSYTIRFTFSNNAASINRRFLKTEVVQLLFDYISEYQSSENIDILNTYPKKSLKPYCNKTLEKCNLKNCSLIVQIK